MAVTAQFSIEKTQYLEPDGTLASDIPPAVMDLVPPEILVELYKQMQRLRQFDQKAIALQRTGKMGTYASTLGQEAISVAVGHAMQADDVLVPFYRDYGAMLQRGVKMSEIYSYWGGDERGSHYENNAHDLPICVPIASQCLHAAGIAYAFKLRNEAKVAVTSIGDGGTSEGDFYEAINVAGAWNLPAVFIINNNQWAISVPLAKQTAAQTLAQKAIAAGIAGEQVDGNDIIACYEAIHKAISKARNGEGPTVIEALTYRLCDHTTADDATRYRSRQETDAAWKQEPLIRLRHYLTQLGEWNDELQQAFEAQCKEEINQAVATYESSEPQAIDSMFDYHYAKLPASLEEQKATANYFARNKESA